MGKERRYRENKNDPSGSTLSYNVLRKVNRRWRLQGSAGVPANLQGELAAGGAVHDQEAGRSEDAQRRSGQEPHPPVAAGFRRRGLTTFLRIIQLKEIEMGIFTQESGNTHHILWIWTVTPPRHDSLTCQRNFLCQILNDSSAEGRNATWSWRNNAAVHTVSQRIPLM